MKKRAVLAVLIVALAIPALGGGIPPGICPIDPKTKLITYRAVVPVEGLSASELYDRAKLWLTKEHGWTKAEITLDDKETGRIVAKGDCPVAYGWLRTIDLRYELTIEVKDGKFRYTLTNLAADGNALEKEVDNPFAFGKQKWETIDAWCLLLTCHVTRVMAAPVSAGSW
jgi:hypothetical protein